MNARIQFLVPALSLVLLSSTFGQGSFQNLNFESANVSGYSSGNDHVPIALAMPGWSAMYSSPIVGTYQSTEIWYNGISLGGPIISVIDANAPLGFDPLDGEFSAALFGGGIASSGIAQTGLVPNGTKSLQAIMWWSVAGPTTATAPYADNHSHRTTNQHGSLGEFSRLWVIWRGHFFIRRPSC